MNKSEYGLTPNGPNIKRLDVILAEMNDSLSEKWGVNTRQNPESFLGHIMTVFADKLAELWEFAEDVYYSQYPSSAEGASLDNAAQYGGSTRESAARSHYPIHCTGTDGTLLAAGTTISTETNPTTYLTTTEDKQITRESFNKANIKVASVGVGDIYTAAINGDVYSYTSDNDNVVSILSGLAEAIISEGFTANVDEKNERIILKSADKASSNTLVLSENLTTETITSIVVFSTVETGNIYIPDGVITNIVKADSGLLEVVNMNGYIAGRDEQTDIEFRKSYADKIFIRSSRMLESIRSAILSNVQGVRSVAPYENPSHFWDDHGRPPHSIEIVVDGGDSVEIAQQILSEKAGGINTFGNTAVVVKGKYDEDITIRFNRPDVIYVWYRLGIVLSKIQPIPPNYVDLLRNVVLENMEKLNAGDDVVPQEFVSYLYKACSGITYIDIMLYSTEDKSKGEPEEYTDRSLEITARQKAYTSESMIEVVIDG